MERSRLFLLEFGGDGARLESYGGLRDPDTRRVCLTPAPAVELERLGLNYAFPQHYLSSAAVQAELEENWCRLEALIALINEHVPFGWTVAYYLKVLLDTCMEKIIHLATVLEAEAFVGEVVVVANGPLPFDYTLTFDESESLYSRLLPLVAAVHAPNAMVMQVPAARCAWRPRAASLAQLKRWAGCYRSALAGIVRGFTRAPGARTICMVEDGYGFEQVVSRLQGNVSLFRWGPIDVLGPPPDLSKQSLSAMLAARRRLPVHRRRCAAAWDAFSQDPRMRVLFTCRAVDFFDLVAPRLRHLFVRIFPALLMLHEWAGQEFARRNVRCLASIYFSRPHTYVLALTAREQGIPVVTMQHSAYGYWHWPIGKYVDGVMSDFRFVGGEGVAHYVKEVERSGCKPIPTGLIPLDAIVHRRGQAAQMARRKPHVVYLLASYTKNFTHYSHSRLAVTEYFEINRAILRVLGRFSEVDVTVRPHPAWQFRQNATALQEWAERQGWRHVHFETRGSTVDAMLNADLIVIDSPSTILVQAVATDRKILLLNRSFPMTETGSAALRKRVGYREELEPFLVLLEETLRRGDFDVGELNEEFLRLYVTHFNDGHTVERVAAALEEIVSSRERGEGR